MGYQYEQQQSQSSTHPLYIIVIILVFVLVFGFLGYAGSIFLKNFTNPYAPGTQANAVANTGITTANNIFNSGYGIIGTGMVLVVIFAFMIDPILSYWKPNKGMAIVNILLIFVIPFLWYVLNVPLGSLSFLFKNTGYSTMIYSFFVSYYFIGIAEISLVISTILNFRRHDNEEHVESASPVMGRDFFGE